MRLCCAFLLVLLSGCHAPEWMIPPVVPVQAVRVVSVEKFEQSVNLTKLSEPQVKTVVESALGDVKAVQEDLGGVDILAGLKSGTVTMLTKGSLVFTVSLDPLDEETFFVEGFGRYVAIADVPSEGISRRVLASADFEVSGGGSLKNIKTSQKMPITLSQFVVATPSLELRQQTESNWRITYDVAVFHHDGVFCLLPGPHSAEFDFGDAKEPVGVVNLKSKVGRKVIDVRSLGLVRRDYEEFNNALQEKLKALEAEKKALDAQGR